MTEPSLLALLTTTLDDAATAMEEMRERIAYLEHELIEAKLQAASARSNEGLLQLKSFQMTLIIAELVSMIVRDDEKKRCKKDMSRRRKALDAPWQILQTVMTKLSIE